MSKMWYKLDNAGKLYPSIKRTMISTIFRISVLLKEDIKKDFLQNALENILKRFPYFKVNLKKGFFWYYFEESKKNPKVEEEKYFPCMFLNYENKNVFPFRIIYFKKKLSLEISHSLTDGTGALVFLQALIIEYFNLIGIVKENYLKILNLKEKISKEEWYDDFKNYYKKDSPLPEKVKKAVHFPFKLVEKGEYYFINGLIETENLKKSAKENNLTIGELILLLYFETIQDYVKALNFKERKKFQGRIVINLPVNLRKIYPSNTMKNFFISLTPFIDLRLGEYSREELKNYIKNYFHLNLNEKIISMYIKRNVSSEKSFFIRTVPLFIKNIAMPIVYKIFGESAYTSSISNLGLIKLPEEVSNKIESFEFISPPSKSNKLKVGVISFLDKTCISFGKLSKNTEIEKIFFRKIRKEIGKVKIKTNLEG